MDNTSDLSADSLVQSTDSAIAVSPDLEPDQETQDFGKKETVVNNNGPTGGSEVEQQKEEKEEEREEQEEGSKAEVEDRSKVQETVIQDKQEVKQDEQVGKD